MKSTNRPTMYQILLLISFIICCSLQLQLVNSELRFSPFRSAFRISSGLASARNNDDDLAESHATLLPSPTRSKPLQTTPFGMATTQSKLISRLLAITENELTKLSQIDSNVENNEVISSNNKRFKNEPSTTLATERPDSATSSLFELSTEASVKQTTTVAPSTTSKPRKVIKITTSSTQDELAAAEAAAKLIANMHSMHFGGSSNKNINRISNVVTQKIPVHHHNPYASEYSHDKINFDVNYRPTEAPSVQSASSSPAKKSKDKNRDSVKTLFNGLVNFVSSPLFTQAKPLIISSFSSVSNALSANRNSAGSSSTSSGSSSGLSGSGGSINAGMISKMLSSLRSFAMLRRNEAAINASKNSKKKGKVNSAVNSSGTSSSNNNLANQSILMNFLDSLIKTREAFMSMAVSAPNKSKFVNKVSTSSSSQSNKNSSLKPSPYSNYLSLFRLLWKPPTGLKQEARSM